MSARYASERAELRLIQRLNSAHTCPSEPHGSPRCCLSAGRRAGAARVAGWPRRGGRGGPAGTAGRERHRLRRQGVLRRAGLLLAGRGRAQRTGKLPQNIILPQRPRGRGARLQRLPALALADARHALQRCWGVHLRREGMEVPSVSANGAPTSVSGPFRFSCTGKAVHAAREGPTAAVRPGAAVDLPYCEGLEVRRSAARRSEPFSPIARCLVAP